MAGKTLIILVAAALFMTLGPFLASVGPPTLGDVMAGKNATVSAMSGLKTYVCLNTTNGNIVVQNPGASNGSAQASANLTSSAPIVKSCDNLLALWATALAIGTTFVALGLLAGTFGAGQLAHIIAAVGAAIALSTFIMPGVDIYGSIPIMGAFIVGFIIFALIGGIILLLRG